MMYGFIPVAAVVVANENTDTYPFSNYPFSKLLSIAFRTKLTKNTFQDGEKLKMWGPTILKLLYFSQFSAYFKV
jgi:hypothetical protein